MSRLVRGILLTLVMPIVRVIFPKVPGEVWEAVKRFLEELPTTESMKAEAVKLAAKVPECRGVACPIKTVKE